MLMQQINFGRIENLIVQGGEPKLEPSPRLIQEIKFGGDNGPRPEIDRGDFELKSQVTELFSEMVRIGNGCVLVLEVKHGLPFRLVFERMQ